MNYRNPTRPFSSQNKSGLVDVKDTEVLDQQLEVLSPLSAYSLIDILRWRSIHESEKLAYTFLNDGETEEINLTYGELDQQARNIAVALQNRGLIGENALLLYPPGLEFIAAFFGCLYAGVVAVPAYPPRKNQSLERIEVIVADANAKIALTTTSLLDSIESSFQENPDLISLPCLATDTLDTAELSQWQEPPLNQDSLAFLQYTSGSTGNPKGVMVTHGNLMMNSAMIYQCFGHHPHSRGVIWLPVYHDMGLMGGVLQPLYGGLFVTLMSPMHFLQKPIRWLQAISRYQATTSGGPNFAYEIVCRKVKPEQLAELDLSSWDLAFSGAEPVRAHTLEQFYNYFAPCGFRREAFYPCYGMAENTLIISGGIKEKAPLVYPVKENALKDNQVIPAFDEQEGVYQLVGCGHPWLDQKVIIVDTDTYTECPRGQVGEIWISGASVAQGYWNQAKLTEEIFQAYLADTGAGPFLRTGDLGFIQEYDNSLQVFVTGRLKDVIIIRGRNHYPQDIEMTVEKSHPAVAPSRGAAFAVEVNGEEKLVIVTEVERRYHERRKSSNRPLDGDERRNSTGRRETPHIDPGFEVDLPVPPGFDAVIGDIRQAVTQHHGLQVYAVLLLRIGTIPKTSSGKIRRHACRNGFLDGSLNVIGGDRHLLGNS